MTTPKEPEPKAPTAEDLRALQSVYDKKLADKDKELATLRAGSKPVAKSEPAVDDDLSTNAEATKLAAERAEFDQAKVTWHRVRIAAEYSLDAKELAEMSDPRDMELYAIKKTRASDKTGGGAAKVGLDREPGQAGAAQAAQDRLRSGLETRFKKLFP